MRILIVNDDGIHAKGLRALAARIARNHEVTVVAPESEKSATSHAITLHRPLRARKTDNIGLEGVNCYVVDGLPVDCTKIGLSHLMRGKADIVVSGINHGPNLGSDIVYSGTVAAALDAVIMGYKALAVSLAAHAVDNINTAAEIAARLIDGGLFDGAHENVLYNLNVPDLPLCRIKGLKAAAQAHTVYDESVELREDPRGGKYIWITGAMRQISPGDKTDVALVTDGYAVITPIKHDFTAKDKMETLECKIKDIKLQT